MGYHMMINREELSALCGLPHIQQLTYLRAIRPYMDCKTGTSGIKRRISYQSIAEQLYIEPHPGIKSQSFSRDQVRRAVAGLVRASIIEVQSEGKQLILKCLLATQHFSAQNKAAINQPQKAAIISEDISIIDHGSPDHLSQNVNIAETSKATTPQDKDNFIFLLSRFEQFWSIYPEKKSKHQAMDAFVLVNPDDVLFQKIMHALTRQIKHREEQSLAGCWVPPWKYPATWLTKRSFEDELIINKPKENLYATHGKATRNSDSNDMFWDPNILTEQDSGGFQGDNVFSFNQHKGS